VDKIIEGMLSPRGSHNIITARGQKGWKDLAQKSRRHNQGSGDSLEMRARDDEQVYSKTVVVTDVPSVLNSVSETLDRIDQMPQQILVQARFMEVNEDVLRDIGSQFGIGWTGDGGNSLGFNNRVFNNQSGVYGPKSVNSAGNAMSGTAATESPNLAGGPNYTGYPDSILDQGGQFFGVGNFDNIDLEMYINLLEEDEDTETLSSPKVLTLNNQEAAIIVGTRYPIIESEFNSSAGGSTAVRSETLEYYESIGIQLNVVPQICADNSVKMVVRPTVTEIIGFSGQNDYPIIKTRDTETQVITESGETIVIGGLLEERESEGVSKIPVLGDIPVLGRLFRRDTTDNKKVDLLIFISATIVDEENYSMIQEPEEEEAPIVIEFDPETSESVEAIMAELNAE